MSGTCSPSIVEISTGTREHLEPCLRIARNLPEYFNAEGLQALGYSLVEDALYVASDKDKVGGFATVWHKPEEVAEISWLAVNPTWQGQRVGKALVQQIEKELVARGMRMLVVKTLAEESNYPPFEATRRFYERVGFLLVETVDPYPGWGGDLAAIYVKALR
jgi:ribosomal protein S18 acetylase RimI-like enzyme